MNRDLKELKEALIEFDKVVACLAIAIHSDVYDDIASKYNRLRKSIMQCNQEIVERK